MKKLWVLISMAVALLVASCAGSGTTLDTTPDANTGVVEGYITEADISRGTSAVDDGIPDVEVWCEEPGTGQRFGQDTTDGNGYYRIEGLPEGATMTLRFRYRHAHQNGNLEQPDVEGEQQIRLRVREQLRVDIGVCERDNDGDGNPDDVECDNDQMQVRLRGRDRGADAA